MMEKWLGMPIQASTHAAQIDQMTVLVHWLMLVLFIGWGAFFIFVLFRFRRGAHPRAGPGPTSRSSAARASRAGGAPPR